MLNKSTENLACAKLAGEHNYCSAGMSRCFYSMYQAAVYFLELRMRPRESYQTLTKKPKGALQQLLQDQGLPGVENGHYYSAMGQRKKADYEPDEITRDRLEEYLGKAEKFYKKIQLLLRGVN